MTLRYKGDANFDHGRPATLGVLLVNLGTPDDPGVPAVRRYLRQFLSDPRVIELPRWLWLPLLNLVILRIRPSRSAKAYRKIWTEDGSPLLVLCERLSAALAGALEERHGERVRVELAMTYGKPSIPDALETLFETNLEHLIVLPLYPQNSGSTAGPVMDQLAEYLKTRRRLPTLSIVNGYHDHPRYIRAVADSVRRNRAEHGSGECLLFSFHGVPRRYLLAGDPYHCECLATARLVAEELGLPDDDWHVTFQSRVGREEWLRPYTDETLREWGEAGRGRIDVVCPGFSVDCLETLEEIAIQNNELYRSAGGGSLHYIECLNDSDDQLALLLELVSECGQERLAVDGDVEARRARAQALGAAR